MIYAEGGCPGLLSLYLRIPVLWYFDLFTFFLRQGQPSAQVWVARDVAYLTKSVDSQHYFGGQHRHWRWRSGLTGLHARRGRELLKVPRTEGQRDPNVRQTCWRRAQRPRRRWHGGQTRCTCTAWTC